MRYLILYHYGGIYLDLDMYPIRDMSKLFDEDYFFTRWHDDKQRLPYIACMGSEPKQEIFQKIAEHCKESTYEKAKDGNLSEMDWKTSLSDNWTFHGSSSSQKKQDT